MKLPILTMDRRARRLRKQVQSPHANNGRNYEMSALDEAREAQKKIAGLTTALQRVISSLDGVHQARVAQVADDRRTGRPPGESERQYFDQVEQRKAGLLSEIRTASQQLGTYRTELTRALSEASSPAVASEPARAAIRQQLAGGVAASLILADAADRFDLDQVRALRAEVGNVMLAQAGGDHTARAEAVKGRAAVEHAADRLLARIGSDDEQEIAKVRLGSTVTIQNAESLTEQASRVVAVGRVDPTTRMAMAYTANDAERQTAGAGLMAHDALEPGPQGDYP